MADLSLSTLPIATAAAPVTPGAVIAEGTADAATPFASLLTALADAPAVGSTPLAPLPGAALPATVAGMPIILTDPGLTLPPPDADIASPGADEDEATPDTPASDPLPAGVTLDLSAFLQLIGPTPQLAAMPARAALPVRAAAIDHGTSPTPSLGPIKPGSTGSVPATSTAPSTAPPVGVSLPAQAEPSTPIAPERMTQAFAAVRALAGEPTARDVSTRAPAPAAVSSANGLPRAFPVAPPPSAPVSNAASATVITAAAQRAAEPTPPAPAIPNATNEARPAPTRARKPQDAIRIADVRTEAAPARIEVASVAQAAPAPLADDPVARQLSIAQDGRWLDSLAKDIASAGNANGQIHFRLDPDHLGSLTVQIAQGSDGASIRLTASSEAARTILADAQPRLVAEARAQGLNLRDATVETRTATAAPAPAASTSAGFGNQSGGGRSSDGGTAAQLQQQSQGQGGGARQRAPDQPARANPAPRAATPARSGADLYA